MQLSILCEKTKQKNILVWFITAPEHLEDCILLCNIFKKGNIFSLRGYCDCGYIKCASALAVV